MLAASTADRASFRFEPSATRIAANERAERLVDPGFGRVFTDHMAIIRYSEAKGWPRRASAARTTARSISSPASPISP